MLVTPMLSVLMVFALTSCGAPVEVPADTGGADRSAVETPSEGSANLVVWQDVECCYSEGSHSWVRLDDAAGETVVEDQSAGGPLRRRVLKTWVDPARYSLRSWQQPCEGACPPDGGLDARTDECDQQIEVPEQGRLVVVVHVKPGEGCSITETSAERAAAGDGVLVGVDVGSGQERLRVPIGGDDGGPPAVADDVVYVVTRGGDGEVLRALSLPDGAELWRQEMDGLLNPKPVVAGDVVLVTVYGGELVALDVATGEVRWSQNVGAETVPTPTVAGELVVVGGDGGGGGAIKAYDLHSGELRWNSRVGGPSGAPAIVVDGTVYVAVYVGYEMGELVALDADDGAVLWTKEVRASLLSSPTVSGDLVVAGGSAGTSSGPVAAFDRRDGTSLWQVDVDGGVYAAPLAVDGQFMVNSAAHPTYGLTALDSDGKQLWRAPMDGEMRPGGEVVDGVAYVAQEPGGLLAVDVDRGRVLWTSPGNVTDVDVAGGLAYTTMFTPPTDDH